MLDGDTPIFQQLAARIADDVVAGTYPEGSAVPSTTEYAAFYRINPITATKAVNVLVEQGVLYKRRGVGMFVAAGAREALRAQRRAEFAQRYVAPLVREAQLLGIAPRDVARMVTEAAVGAAAETSTGSTGTNDEEDRR